MLLGTDSVRTLTPGFSAWTSKSTNPECCRQQKSDKMTNSDESDR